MIDPTISRRAVLKGLLAELATIAFSLALCAGVARAEEALKLTPGLKQLFIDDCFFAEQEGIKLRVNPPAKAGRVLAPEKPWEKGVVGLYTTVLEDDGIYRMWYDAIAKTTEEKYKSTPRSLCYATSEDGIHWRREMVNLFDWHGHREKNIVMPGGSASVMIDPKARPESRYKALGFFWASDLWEWEEAKKGPDSGIKIHVFTSSDGIRWKRVRPVASPFFHDSLNVLLYDDRVDKYVAYFRVSSQEIFRGGEAWFDDEKVFWDRDHKEYRAYERGGVQYFDPGRGVGRIELDDPTETPWPYRKLEPKPGKNIIFRQNEAFDVVMSCDENDPPHTDVQMAPVNKYPGAEDVYLALWTNYRHFGLSPEAKGLAHPGGTRLNDGVQDVQLAVSRDGVHWSRPDRRPYIEMGLADGPEGGVLWPTNGMVRRAGEIYQYYCAETRTHGAFYDTPENESGLYRLVQRLDGFISADAGHQGGRFTTPPLTFSGTRLEFNLNASALGYLTVEIQDEAGNPIPGFTLEESLPIDRNRLAAPARWSSGKSVADLQGRPIRLHVAMRACKLYAFAFTHDDG
jgi:hypothetical protein